MAQQFYVSPEQLMKDRADFARKGIARGRSVVVVGYAGGIALVAQNPSPTLHKLGEIYDRIGFAAVGKYNEFEGLRQAGVRYADLRGYSYARADVTARGLANVYAQSLGAAFTADQKPFEVELAVAEVGDRQATDHLFRLSFDGSISDEPGYLAMGGEAEKLQAQLRSRWHPDASLPQVLGWAAEALRLPRDTPSPGQGAPGTAPAGPPAGTPRGTASLTPAGLPVGTPLETPEGAGTPTPDGPWEVAVLERARPSARGQARCFRRLTPAEVAQHRRSRKED